jgi:hypothetical protein
MRERLPVAESPRRRSVRPPISLMPQANGRCVVDAMPGRWSIKISVKVMVRLCDDARSTNAAGGWGATLRSSSIPGRRVLAFGHLPHRR